MVKFTVWGAVVGLISHVIATFGLLVSTGVFAADESAASADPMIYVWAAVCAMIWALVIAATTSPRRAAAAVLAYIVVWSIAGAFTFGATWWWALSIAVTIGAAGIGWGLGTLVSRHRRLPRDRTR